MEEQVFFNDVRCSFNLRQPKSDKATNIYLVAYINGEQIKVSTNVKVNAAHWNKERQEAYISFRLTTLDNNNNKIVNKRLNEIRNDFNDFKTYICNNPILIGNAKEILRRYINKYETEKKSAISLMWDAFYKMYPNNNSTTKTNEYRLRMFVEYIKNNKFEDKINVILTQNMLDKYKSYLINLNKNGVKNINDRCEIVKRIINNKLAVSDEYKCYNIAKVEYIIIKDKRKKEDSKKTPLTKDEVEAIKNVKLRGKLAEYRDAFLMQCYCGVRISDLLTVFNCSVCLDNDEDEEIVILTKKERIEAVITFDKEMKEIRRRYVKGFKWITNKQIITGIDAAIKEIALKANLVRSVEWKEQLGDNNIVTKEMPLYAIISSHYARHTFITNKILEGWDADKLCYASGHADSKMIRQIYTHLSQQDKINIIKSEKKRLNAGND